MLQMEHDKTVGAITWTDLTVNDADAVRGFYQNIVGWKLQEISMGDYNDYCVVSPEDNVVRAGICHARGANASVPPVWIMYVNVANLDEKYRRGHQR